MLPEEQLPETAEMKCPVCCTTNLVMSERFGIEIDCCPQRRGAWLDRGDLGKIIERSIFTDGVGQPHRETTAYQQNNNH